MQTIFKRQTRVTSWIIAMVFVFVAVFSVPLTGDVYAAGAAAPPASNGTVTVPATQTGSFTLNDRVTWNGSYYEDDDSTRNFDVPGRVYRVQLTAGQGYVFTLEDSGSDVDDYHYDPLLYLLDQYGNVVAENDDNDGMYGYSLSLKGLDSAVVYTPAVSGYFYIVLSSYSAGSAGNYRLKTQTAPTGSISGTISPASAGSTVSFYYYVQGYDEEEEYTWDEYYYAGWASVGQNGAYTKTNLFAGDYVVLAYGFDDYANQYYGNTGSRQTAAKVSLAANGSVPGINITLPIGYTISGQVKDTLGIGVSGIEVSAESYDDGTYRSAETDITGRYTIRGLSEGNYWIRFDGNGEYYVQSGSRHVSVSNGNVTGIDAIAPRAGKISGRVAFSQGRPPADLYIRTYMYDANDNDWYYYTTGYIDEDGSYTIGGLPPGKYRLYYYVDNYYSYAQTDSYVPQFYPNAGSLETATDVIVTAGQTSAVSTVTLHKQNEITISFNSAGGSGVPSRVLSKGAALGPLPVPQYAGFTLEGWYTPGSAKVSPQTTFDADTTLTANWTAVQAQGDPPYVAPPADTNALGATQSLSKDAKLKSLKISKGSLSPKYKASKTKYTIKLKKKVGSTKITVKQNFGKAKVQFKVGKKGKFKSAKSLTVKVAKGKSKVVYVKVTAEDGKTVKTYTVTVKRAKK